MRKNWNGDDNEYESQNRLYRTGKATCMKGIMEHNAREIFRENGIEEVKA